jgi:hypothetical protein
MDPKERRNLGAHYTSEKNILKLIKPLFLDELWEEFHKIKGNKRQLKEYQMRLGKLKFLDPACGCGNFLIITYRELRLLELEVMKEIYKGQQAIGIQEIMCVDVDQFYGIEYEEFPARIAEVAMWLIDHQMNLMISEEFGMYYTRLPLKKSAKIFHGNALKMNWGELIDKNLINIDAENTILQVNEPLAEYEVKVRTNNLTIIDNRPKSESLKLSAIQFDYIIGNPPFIGKSQQSSSQKDDLELIFNGVKGAGILDYVAAWYLKAAQLVLNTRTKVAFVSTNSISQGEQVGILWNLLFNLYKVKIHFAHQTFNWSNEARGKAAVHCIIIGFANYDIPSKRIFAEQSPQVVTEVIAKNINPYLFEGRDLVVQSRTTPVCDVPKMVAGNKAIDGGNFIFTDSEKEEFILKEPLSAKYFRQFIGSEEFINRKSRWCLWLKNIDPKELNQMPLVKERIKNVQELRLKSTDPQARNLANYPTTFRDTKNPKHGIIIPLVSSERRKYIPLGIITEGIIPSNLCSFIEIEGHFHIGVLSSIMHMAWVRVVCGRLESRYRYSNDIVYNNFPWPKNPSEKNKALVEEKAQKVLYTRAKYPDSSLADLYDPLLMPPDLVKAHQELDRAVDQCYRPQPFTTEMARIEYLFELYEEYLTPLLGKVGKGKK